MREDDLFSAREDRPARFRKAGAGTGSWHNQLQTVLTRLAVALERNTTGGEPEAEHVETYEQADWSPPALTDDVLQVLRFSAPRSGARLAYRVSEGQVHALDTGLRLDPGTRVSFDAYLNSFYEHYWLRHAPVEDLTIRLYGWGTVLVDLIRAMPDGSSHKIAQRRVELNPDEGGTAAILLDVAPAAAGRIFFEVIALSEAAILAGRIETASKPVRPVRIGIGLCTFNREKMLLGNLRRLVQSQYYRWAHPKVVIVNQGSRFGSDAMAALLAAEQGQVTAVEQANLGGVGGFTRSAMEIVRGGECSYVLFMDDDIEIDPDVLITTHAFAARTTKPTVVGGSMVDLFQPTMMYEAGAVIGSANILRASLHNRSLARRGTLRRLARETPVHFNGWWYCAIPTAAFKEHGLPLPIFIRGDDIEYGARLFERGIPTVALPPVSVWHEPFYAKPPSWQLYYDLRNRLIFAACHSGLAHLDPPGVILRRVIDSLLKHDYMHLELVIRAVDDFLAGPAVLDKPMDVLHREISALAAAHAPVKLASTVGLSPANARKPRRGLLRPLTLAWGLGNLYFGRIRRKMRPDLIPTNKWHPRNTVSWSEYAVVDPTQSSVQVYRYDREKLRTGLKRGLKAVQRYRAGGQDAAHQWRAAHPELTSWERWDRILGLDRAVMDQGTELRPAALSVPVG